MSAINKTEEAIKVLEDYLESKKNKDRQIQFELVSLYLSIGNLNSAEKLIDDILEIARGKIDNVTIGRTDLSLSYFDPSIKPDSSFIFDLIDPRCAGLFNMRNNE